MKYFFPFLTAFFLFGIIFLAGCVTNQSPQQPSEPAAKLQLPVAPDAEPEEDAMAEPEEDAAPSAFPDREQETRQEPAASSAPAEKEDPQLAPEHATPNIVVLSEKTILGTASDITKKEERKSWFSDVICGKLFPDGDSLVTFTLENRGQKSYHLTRVGIEDVTEKDGVNIRLNSNRILTEPQKQCGTELLQPGEKATCTVKKKLRKGQTYWEKELINKLAATSVGLYSELKFTCDGLAE